MCDHWVGNMASYGVSRSLFPAVAPQALYSLELGIGCMRICTVTLSRLIEGIVWAV